MKTDTQLQEDVMAELKWEPSVHASQIGVAVDDGIVTLSGHVSSFLEKWNAECAAQRVVGVKALAVDLDVRLPYLGKRSDEDIARSADSALEWMKSPAKDVVHVMVEGGRVTLSGEVRWQYQKQAAADAMRNLVGLTGLRNQIVINPKATLTDAGAEIEASLSRRARHAAQNIQVQVHGAVVTLCGSVGNWAERQTAVHAAWSMPGVRNVVDKLVLTF